MRGNLFLLVGLLVLAVACSNSGKQQVDDVVGSGEVHFKPGDVTAPEETIETTVEPDDVSVPDIGTPPGYLEFCLADGDCADWGLQCYADGPADQNAFCSTICDVNSDCPAMMVCGKKGDNNICQAAKYCDLCDNDAQCGPEGHCIEDKTGTNFCTYPCAKDDLEACGAADFCNKIGLGLEDYYCFPMFGQCKGNGSHCTPCQDSNDCLKGHECHENAYTYERYCAKICQVMTDCPKGFGCHELQGEEYPLCTLEIDDLPVETCYKENKGFCEPCMDDYECSSGVCYNYPVANKYFCSFPCDYDKYPQMDNKGCPTGLFCIPNHGQSGGDICAPALAFGCQGFLNCVAVDCPKGEKCVDGFCEPK